MTAYKFLRRDGTGVFTSRAWPLPGPGGPGAWVEAPLDPCRSGIHACRVRDLPLWLGQELYEIELGGDIVEARTKVVASRRRLLRRIVAARIAEERDGVGAYHDERARQVAWLRGRLGL